MAYLLGVCGPTCGKGGNRFIHFNIAKPREVVLETMDLIEAALSDLQ